MRIQSIDYLRGLMSLSIVIYHFSISFTNWGLNDSGTLFGKLGVYAVSAFYVISGMALYLAHKNDSWNLSNYFIFIFRRFLRLAPVYWVGLAIFTAFSYQYISGFSIDLWKYTQNIFLIFGLTNPTDYILMGGWSIGNEVVFYLFFPALILLTKNRYVLLSLTLASLILLVYCSIFYLDSSKGIVEQWSSYINPINQIYFFVFGIVLAKVLLPHVGKNKALFLFVIFISSLAFIYHPVCGNQINIIVGWNKLFFTSVTILICAMFFLLGDLISIKSLHITLKFLGDISYPLYLLHGALFMYFGQFFVYPEITDYKLVSYGAALLLVLFTLSLLCHMWVEKPIIRLSKRFIKPQSNRAHGCQHPIIRS